MTAIDFAGPRPPPPVPRDYSLTGPSSKAAVEAGLAAAEWYHTEVPRKVMKELMQRRDGPAIRDTILWAALHVLFAAGRHLLLGLVVVACRSGSPTACSTARPATRAGTSAGTARPSGRAG